MAIDKKWIDYSEIVKDEFLQMLNDPDLDAGQIGMAVDAMATWGAFAHETLPKGTRHAVMAMWDFLNMYEDDNAELMLWWAEGAYAGWLLGMGYEGD